MYKLPLRPDINKEKRDYIICNRLAMEILCDCCFTVTYREPKKISLTAQEMSNQEFVWEHARDLESK